MNEILCVHDNYDIDFQKVIRCHNQAILTEDFYSQEQKLAWIWGREHISALLSRNESVVLISLSNRIEEVVGFIMLDTKHTSIEGLYVSQKRERIGEFLLNIAFNLTRNFLTVISSINTIEFYKKYGFLVERFDTLQINGIIFEVAFLQRKTKAIA